MSLLAVVAWLLVIGSGTYFIWYSATRRAEYAQDTRTATVWAAWTAEGLPSVFSGVVPRASPESPAEWERLLAALDLGESPPPEAVAAFEGELLQFRASSIESRTEIARYWEARRNTALALLAKSDVQIRTYLPSSEPDELSFQAYLEKIDRLAAAWPLLAGEIWWQGWTGNADRAWEELESAIRLLESFRRDPVLRAAKMRADGWRWLAMSAAALLVHSEPDPSVIERIQGQVERAALSDGLRNALLGETVLLNHWLRAILADRAGVQRSPAGGVLSGEARQEDREGMLSLGLEAAVALRRPLGEARTSVLQALITAERSAMEGGGQRRLAVELRSASETACMAEAWQGILLGHLAAARYRWVVENFPSVWEDLLPSYLGSVPLDPFRRKALLLRRDERGFAVYSVGLDGEDQLGQFPDPLGVGPDIGVRRK